MNGGKHSAVIRGARRGPSAEARKILNRHFGFPDSAAKNYVTQASHREGRKVIEIESAVIRLTCDFS